MPRIARGLADGLIYHVINRGNGRQDIFHKSEDYHAFVDLIGEAKEKFSLKLFAYCLMPNHFHLLLSPNKGDDLSRWMQWFMTSHVRRYHQHYHTNGHIWQGRYKSFIVQEDTHLLTVVRYIEGNPVRAQLATSAGEWNWSSHRARLNGARMLDELPITLPGYWTETVDTPMTDNELEKLQRSLDRQSPFGGVPWLQRMCGELGLEATIRPRGRPKKWGQEK